jgi:hypothetical protein
LALTLPLSHPNLTTRFPHVSPLRLFHRVGEHSDSSSHLYLTLDGFYRLPRISTIVNFDTLKIAEQPSPWSCELEAKTVVRPEVSSGRTVTKGKKHSRDCGSPCQAVCLLPLAHLCGTHVVLAVGNIAIRRFAAVILGNTVAGDSRCDSTNMRGNVVILLSPYIVEGDRQCFWNLRRTSTLFDGASEAFSLRGFRLNGVPTILSVGVHRGQIIMVRHFLSRHHITAADVALLS